MNNAGELKFVIEAILTDLPGRTRCGWVYRQQAADSGKQLADAFIEVVLSDRIKKLVRPMRWDRI